MIICLCKATTDRDVVAAIENGAASLRDLQQCGIGTDCGTCHSLLRTMIRAVDAAESASSAPSSHAPLRPATLATSA